LTYKELFAKYRIVKQLSTLQLFAYFGAWFSNVAIYSMLVDFGASAIIISIVAAMHFIPGIILSPFSGTIVDRVNAKKLMTILLSLELTMTLSFLLIDSLDDIWLLLILLFIRMSCASMFFTTEMTLLPKLLDGEVLAKANEIHSIIWSFTFTAGMALGGIIVNLFGVKIAFLIDGMFFIISLFLLSRIYFEYEHIVSNEEIFESVKSGIEYIKRNKHIITLMLLHGAVGLTAFDTLVTLLADYHYKYIIAVPLAIGLSNATRAFALMIGPFFISKWINKQRLFYIFILQGLFIILWASVQSNFYIGLFGIFLTGFVTTTLWSHTYAILQEYVDQSYLGRVLAYNEMVFMSSTVVTTLFIGIMASLVPLAIITSILGIVFIFVAFYYKRNLVWILKKT
jgi:MFS family permease